MSPESHVFFLSTTIEMLVRLFKRSVHYTGSTFVTLTNDCSISGLPDKKSHLNSMQKEVICFTSLSFRRPLWWTSPVPSSHSQWLKDTRLFLKLKINIQSEETLPDFLMNGNRFFQISLAFRFCWTRFFLW